MKAHKGTTEPSMPYTAEEVCRILREAKAAGVTVVRLPGIEAEWEIPQSLSQAAPAAESTARNTAPADRPPNTRERQGVRDIPAEEDEQQGDDPWWCNVHNWRKLKGRNGKPYCGVCNGQNRAREEGSR